ncbi:MAG: POTRA domain-containing protein [Phycisphaerales bacterium]|nr:POTRA domain-containing protein [Phycisphaerales bacterium]
MRYFLFSILWIGYTLTSILCVAQKSNPLTHSPFAAHSSDNYSQNKTITAIHIIGNKRTQSAVILRELSIKTDDIICSDSLKNILHLNYQRLYNLNLFTDIQLSWTFIDSNRLEINVTLQEQWFLLPQADIQLADRNINVWWKEQNHNLSRINLGLYLVHKNLTGRMDKLSTNMHLGYTQQFAISYFRPYIDRQQKQGIGFRIGYSRSKELAYATTNNKLKFVRHDNDFLYQNFFSTLSWYYRPAYHTRHIVNLGYNAYRIGDTILQLNQDFFEGKSKELQYVELSYRYEYNGVDNWNYPRKGIKIIGNLDTRLGSKGMNQQAFGGVEFGYYKAIKNRWYSSFIFRGRATFTQVQGYFFQAALGYKSNYVRGYEYYVVEANQFAIARLTLKYEAIHRQYHHLAFQYLPELPIWVYPKLFFDVGYAANSKIINNNNFANSLLYSFGFGIDIITAYDLKLRIEFAYNHLAENGLYLHANSE